jgi:hypothetical protein
MHLRLWNYRSVRKALTVAASVALCGCGATTRQDDARTSALADAGPSSAPMSDDPPLNDGAALNDDAASAGECGDAAIATADLAATPRENTLAEVLAILADQGPLATDAGYQRAVRDHDALIGVDARLSRFWWSGANPAIGNQIDVQISGEASLFVEAAECVNQAWGANLTSELEIGDSLFVHLELDGVFNLGLLTAAYAQVPSVIEAHPQVPTPLPVITDNEAFVRRVVRNADVYTYSFVITKLDCNIELAIAVDADGLAEVAEWKSLPDVSDCQRVEPGL